MKAAFTVEPRRMEVRDVAEPVPGPDEALVRIDAVGLCGSDLHLYLGHHPYRVYPQTQGHELAGTIVAFGGPYEGPLKVGDRVAIEPLRPCGACYACRHGHPNCCTRLQVLGVHVPGGLAELYAVKTENLYTAGDLDRELTALVEPISIGLHAVVRGQVTGEDRVAVFGAGPIGQAILLAATDRGARVLVVDRIPARLDLARTLGSERVVDVNREAAAEVIAEQLIGPDTVDTMPLQTIEAFLDHAVVERTVDKDVDQARAELAAIEKAGISMDEVTLQLQKDGVKQFADSFDELIDAISARRQEMMAQAR